MDAITMKMDTQCKELQFCPKQSTPDHNDDNIPMSREEEAKFMQTFYVLKKYLCSKQEVSFQDTQTDCIQDTAQRIISRRLKTCIDAERRCPTIKKLEVKQVEFKLGEDCWEIQARRSKYCRLKDEKVKVLSLLEDY
ncbi:hypothetical protein Tco_0884414 [Tanacetum coccineum]